MIDAPQKPETAELAAALKSAYAGTLRHGAQLLNVWKSNLSDVRAREIAAFEAKDFSLALLIGTPGGRVKVDVMLVDASGGIMRLDGFDLIGGSLAIN